MIAFGCDHAGIALKETIFQYLEKNGYEYKDFGCFDTNSVDYPVYAKKVAHAVASGECEKGILVCGTGIGISIAANKVKGIRAALCHDVYSAKMTKQHNNANIICMGGRVIGRELAFMIVDTWLSEEFLGGRHLKRIEKIHKLEEYK